MLKNFRHANPFVVYGAFFFIVIAVAGLFLSISGQWGRMQSSEPKPSVGAYPDEFKTNELEFTGRTIVPDASTSVDERNEIATRLREQAKEISEERNHLAQLASDLKSNFSLLLDNPAGRKISASSDLIDRFILCEDEFQKTNAELPDILSAFEILQLKILEAADAPLSSNLGFATQTADLRKKALGLRTRLEDQEFRLGQILNGAKQLQTTNISLKEAINLQRASTEDSRIRLFKNGQKQEAEKRAAELAEIARQQAEADFQLKKQLELSRVEELKAQAEADRKRSELAIQRKQLEVEFEKDLPQINHYLGVLFVRAPTQIIQGKMVPVKDPVPVSYAGLRSVYNNSDRATYEDATKNLLSILCRTVGGRGSGPYSSDYYGEALSSRQLEAIRPAYLLLEKYGLLLVEKGMLAP